MELSSITLRVLLLFFPGVVCALVVDALTVHRERTPVQFLTNAFALGIGSYLTLYVLRALVAIAARLVDAPEPLDISFFAALLDERVRIAWGEIAFAGCAAMILALGVSATLNHRLLARVGRQLRVSHKTGSLDRWSALLQSRATQFVLVRDLSQDRSYYGTLEAYSETLDPAEILLVNVAVFQNASGAKLYSTDRVYLARAAHDLVIESPRPLILER